MSPYSLPGPWERGGSSNLLSKEEEKIAEDFQTAVCDEHWLSSHQTNMIDTVKMKGFALEWCPYKVN